MSGVRVFVLVALVGGVTALMVGTSFQRTNCGGNTAALHTCQQFAVLFEENAGGKAQFSISALALTASSEEIVRSTRAPMASAEFLVLDPSKPVAVGKHDVIFVCARPFGNIPRPTIWNLYRANTAYAAAFSDGTAGLISPEGFAALDKTGFVDAARWAEALPQR